MLVTGEMLLGAATVRGRSGMFRAVNPATGEELEPAFGGGTRDDVDTACRLADEAFDTYRETPLPVRANFLKAIAQNIMDLGDALIERAMAETGLPRGRIEGERARTVGQLHLFATVVRDGQFLDARIDPALPEREPLPRPDLRERHIAIGPVAVFGASNFPLAFSVAGGDTAAALAAGCPVIAKAHPAHPGTSELVGRAVRTAVAACDLPEGVFSLLVGVGNEIGGTLVADPRIKAVGFTGSRAGGLALCRIASGRPEPIPVYAEMSSVNPVFLLPGALSTRSPAIAKGLVASMILGAGQFCTNPGLVLALADPMLDNFLAAAAAELSAAPAATMLTPTIHAAYDTGVRRLQGHARVRCLAQGQPPQVSAHTQGRAFLFATDADSFLHDKTLQQEVFGAASLVVACPNVDTIHRLAERFEGQLTATLHMEESDIDIARRLLPTLERKAGRILVNGFPTGVEVSHAMVHGGPFPATSDAHFTSVGTLSIRRFLRPVCYQNLPAALLPAALRDGNPLGIWRSIDGRPIRD